MNNIFYTVGEKIFYNRYLAFAESQLSKSPVKFHLFENSFDCSSWIEPTETWEQLLDQRAIQLASLGKPIIIGFSGGTDSLTIYNVFKRNRIKIHGMVLKHRTDILSEKVLPFLHSEAESYGFEVYALPQNLWEQNLIFDSSEWMFSDNNPRLQFGMQSYADIEIHRKYFKIAADEDFIHVTGQEKPRIKVIGNRFYSYQEDTAWSMHSDPRIHSFFLSGDFPKLHVKQSYMVARLIKKMSAETGRACVDFQNIHNAVNHDYYRYSYEGCGRHGDLAYSNLSKMQNIQTELYIPNDDPSKLFVNQGYREADAMEESIKDHAKFMKNYAHGLLSLRHDPIMSKIFRDPNNYFSVRTFKSKFYQLADISI